MSHIISVQEQSLEQAIIEAISNSKDISPDQLSSPLYDSVEVEAMKKIVQDDNFSGEIVFQYLDHQVRVTDDEQVFVDQISTDD